MKGETSIPMGLRRIFTHVLKRKTERGLDIQQHAISQKQNHFPPRVSDSNDDTHDERDLFTLRETLSLVDQPFGHMVPVSMM
jgi:hypothetical protein